MIRCFIVIVIASMGAALAACSEMGRIQGGEEVYTGISPDAHIYLSGTEPFWTIEIRQMRSSGHKAHFSTPDDIDGELFDVTMFAGNNGVGFSGTLDGKPAQIAITPGECTGGMSDRGYPFTATVRMGDATLFGCAYTDETPFTELAAP